MFQPLHPLQTQWLWFSQYQDRAPDYVLRSLGGLPPWPLHSSCTGLLSSCPVFHIADQTSPPLKSLPNMHDQATSSNTWVSLLDRLIMFGWHLRLAYMLICSASIATRAEGVLLRPIVSLYLAQHLVHRRRSNICWMNWNHFVLLADFKILFNSEDPGDPKMWE